jgi:hypothetical protein
MVTRSRAKITISCYHEHPHPLIEDNYPEFHIDDPKGSSVHRHRRTRRCSRLRQDRTTTDLTYRLGPG